MKSDFDIIVIGSGPGGYTAAIKAAQSGYKTAIVEKYPVLGGTCTNVGCIPSKALLDSSEHYHDMLEKFGKEGISFQSPGLDFTQFLFRKTNVVKQNTDGLNFLMKKNKITVFTGMASFINSEKISITTAGNSVTELSARYFIIATGSKPSSLPGIKIDKKRIISSTEALSLIDRPTEIAIIGGGVIGVEMASIFARIGVKVTIIEFANSLIPTMDSELGKELQKLLKKLSIDILLDHKVKAVANKGEQVLIQFEDEAGLLKEITSPYCLVAVGRKPYTEGLGLENTTVKTDEKGRIITNENLQTGAANIYAIGDVVKGAMLAHKAEDEGVLVVDIIHGDKSHINYDRIPNVVYTWPEVASVGFTEEQLKKGNIEYRTGKFPFIASGRARAAGDTEGFVKILSDPKYGEILGVHIIGARAADLIAQSVIAMEFEITAKELGRISYAHPTYSEALKDAYLESSGDKSINK
jgi:dihydrolipoamide dehydrogenase